MCVVFHGQVGNVALFLLVVLLQFVPFIWIIFILILWEGLLGGAAYVYTFHRVTTEVIYKLQFCAYVSIKKLIITILFPSFFADRFHLVSVSSAWVSRAWQTRLESPWPASLQFQFTMQFVPCDTFQSDCILLGTRISSY